MPGQTPYVPPHEPLYPPPPGRFHWLASFAVCLLAIAAILIVLGGAP